MGEGVLEITDPKLIAAIAARAAGKRLESEGTFELETCWEKEEESEKQDGLTEAAPGHSSPGPSQG
jgi:hypothetical protein